MRYILLIFALLLTVPQLTAQFARVQPNTSNFTSRSLTKAAGDNEFVSVINGELYQLTFDSTKTLNVEWIDNSIIDVFDFVMHDIDRDGDKDIMCYEWVAGGFQVYLKEEGKFIYYPEWNLNYNNPHFLHSQDFDGDGFEDLMINHNVYKNTGINERTRVLRYPLGNTYYYKNVHFMDYDDDGDTDILFHQVHRLWILVDKGTEPIFTSINLNETNNVTSWSRVIKTTDGEKIIYFDRGVNKIREVVFTDSATYVIKDLVDVTLDPGSSDVIVYDLDNDGTEEIIINSYSYRDITVFKYDVDNQTGKTITLQLNTPQVLAFGMLEVESEPILFIAKEDSYETYSFNDTLRPVFMSSTTVGIKGYNSGFKDMDGDGHTDIIGSGLIMPYLGSGEFGAINDLALPSTGGSLIDYDQDGDLDYVKLDEWYENLGDNIFGVAIEIPDTDPTPDVQIFFTKELIRRDIDKDGDIDILTYNNFGEPLELLENDNNLGFFAPVTIATSDDISGDIVYIDILDMDGDDINDILFATHSGMVFLKGKGFLNFDPAKALYSGNNKPLTVDVDDINYDGFPDVVLGTRNIIAGSTLGETVLYIGNDTFPTAKLISAASGYHRAAFANIDGSGMLDIVQLNSDELSWKKLNADYSFESEQIDVSFLANGVFRIDDVDSDDDDDIILYRDNTLNIYYYLNGESINQGDACPPGDIYVRDQSQVDRYKERYGSCSILYGGLNVGKTLGEWSDIDDISVFSNVRHIKGDLKLIMNNMIPDFQGFSSLEKIDGSLEVIGHKSSIFAGIEKLRYVGGDFYLNNVSTIGTNSTNLEEFESLDTILGNVHILRSNVGSIKPILQSTFYGDLMLENAFTFNDLDSFDIVDTIMGQLLIRETALVSLEGLNEIEFIGSLIIQDNQSLFDFDALHNIEHIDGDVYIGNNYGLNMDEGLEALKTVGGDLYVQAGRCGAFERMKRIGGKLTLITKLIGDKSFSELDSIGGGLSILTYTGEDFQQFSNVKSVGGRLNITNNDITSIYGLHNISNEVASLDIVNNDYLRSLDGLNDSITVEGEWRLFNNYDLNYCNVLPLCRHIANGRPVEVSNNGIDCQDISDLRCTKNIVSGFVYHDFNMNGVKDDSEALLPNVRISLGSSLDTFITSNNGYYLTSALEGDSVKIQVIIPQDWSSTGDELVQIDSFITGDPGNYGNNFGLIPDFEKSELSTNYNQGLFLCDRDYDIDIEVFNKGTFVEEAFVRIYYPEYVELQSGFMDYTDHDVINRILYFTLDPINPFFSYAISIPFVAPSAAHIEEIFKTSIEILRKGDFDLELVDLFTYENKLLCSFDPNDKLVRSSNGSKDIHLNSDDELIYTIRFQNTGNYFAENVRIIDTLSGYLDWASFEFIASSHPVEIKQRDSVFYFNFYEIYLPDSLMNFAGSQGFVTFRIKPLSAEMAGLEIVNEADIYFFDYNEAILTNLVRSEVVDITSVGRPIQYALFEVYPNPTKRFAHIRIDQENKSRQLNYSIYNVMGRLVGTGDLVDATLDISDLDAGVYFVSVQGEFLDYGIKRLVIIDD